MVYKKMKKILLLLLMILPLCLFSQQKKVTIGGFTLYDSSGTLVITGGDLKVNSIGWILPKDLDSTVAGTGLSLNTALGIRFNAGTGTVITNDSVGTQDASGIWDSVVIGGLTYKSSADSSIIPAVTKVNQLWVDAIRNNYGDAIINFIFDTTLADVGTINVNGLTAITFYGGVPLSTIEISPYTHFFDTVVANKSIITSESLVSEGGYIYSNAGQAGTVGTLDNYDLIFVRANNTYLTLGTSNLIVEGNTPLKFVNSSVFSSGGAQVGTLGNAPTVGDPTKYLIIYDNNGDDYAIPMWAIP